MAKPQTPNGNPGRATAVSTAQVLTGVAALLAMLYYLSAILVPLATAFVLAVLVAALVRFIEKWLTAPAWIVSIAAGIVIIVSAAAAIFALAEGMVRVVGKAPEIAVRIDDLLFQMGQWFNLDQPLHAAELIGDVGAPQLAALVLTEMQGFGTGLLLTIVYFGFMLAGQDRMRRKVEQAASSSEHAATINATFRRVAADIQTYVWIETVIGLILTAATTLILMVVKLDNVAFWAILFFLLTFIPHIGVTIGSVALGLFALIQYPTAWQAAAIFLSVQVVAIIVGNLVYPKMQAQTQNIDPLAVLLSLSLWGFLWGLAGAFLAVPMTLMIMKVLAQVPGTRWVAAALSNDGKLETPTTSSDDLKVRTHGADV